MTEMMADHPNYPGVAYSIESNGTDHSNRVGGRSDLTTYQPVPGQPGVYTDGTETFATTSPPINTPVPHNP